MAGSAVIGQTLRTWPQRPGQQRMNQGDLVNAILESLTARMLSQLALVVGGAAVLIVVGSKLISWLAKKLHGSRRLYLLASVPLLRLLIIVVAPVMPRAEINAEINEAGAARHGMA